MNFYINQNSTLPVLSMELIENTVNKPQKFYDQLENATIKFFMEELNSCIPTIQCAECCLTVETDCSDCHNKIFIQYKWQNEDTAIKGKYRGWFEITFLESSSILIAPIQENLIINVI